MEQNIDINNEEIINLVIARLRTIPHDASLSVGSSDEDSLTSEDLIEEVRNKTPIGKKIIERHIFFLRNLQDLPTGEVYA